MSFLKGFQYAFCGIIHCVKNERNMRFHTVAALYVLIFARFFHFTRAEYVLLLLTIGGVLAAEAINTSIEELCDKVCLKKDEHIRRAKDAAAGSVLILAFFAAIIGIVMFSDAAGWLNLFEFYGTHPVNLTALIVSAAAAVLFIVFVPKKQQHNIQTKSKDDHKE